MTLPVDAAAAAAFASDARGACWLVDMHFASAPLYVTTYSVPIQANGREYLALGNLSSVGALSESQDASAERVSLGLSIVNPAMIAATLGNVGNYRGRRVALWLQLIGSGYQPVGAPVLRWQGYMDQVAINRRSSTEGKSSGQIEMRCSRAGMARSRRAPSARLTHEQQSARYPDDTGLRYVRGLIEQPALWLSKAFQRQD